MPQVTQYEDFEIVVSADGSNFFAQVLKSPAGESARFKLELPFDQTQVLLRLENAILRSVRPVRSGRLEGDLRNIGEALFRSLLVQTNDIRDLYTGSRKWLKEGTRLRVKLRIEPEPLGALPWEYFYDNVVLQDYLALDAQTTLVRYMQLPLPVPQLAIAGPLRILGMVANPPGDFAELSATDERKRIDKAIRSLHESGEVDFQWVFGETHNDLFDAIYRGPWHVFHFIGHGGVDENGEGFVVFAGEAGKAEEISATKLKRLLRSEESLRLVVLNCCDSARGSTSMAKSLVQSGIPAVLAMQFPISDQAAIELASGFYTALANGEPVDGAVTHARIKIKHMSHIEWGIPVLYMRSRDGQIFAKQLVEKPVMPIAANLTAASPRDGVVQVQPDRIAPRTPELVSNVATPDRNGRLDSGTFSDLERNADEQEAELRVALFGDGSLETLSQDRLEALVEAGEKVRAGQPDDEHLKKRLAMAYFQLGSGFQKQNSLSKAFVNISKAVELDKTASEYLYARANIFARGDQFDFATTDIDQAIALAPQHSEFYWAKGVICLLAARTDVHQEQLEVAVKAFSAAIDLDGEVAKYYSSRGAALSRLMNREAALEDLDTALKLDPGDGKSYYNRGSLRAQLGDLAGATDDFRNAAKRGHALANAELRRLLGQEGARH